MSTAIPSAKRRTLSQAKILHEAIRIADAEGLDGLSMRRLAQGMNVTPMSLYNHVANKDEMLDGMVNEIVAEIESPDQNGDWGVMMRRRALSMRQMLLRHKWASVQLISRMTLGPNIARDLNATVGCLVTAGFSYGQADWARNAIDSHVYGYTLQELNYPVEPEEYQAAASSFLPAISIQDYPFLFQAAQQIVEAHYDGATQFEFGLDLILEGLREWHKTNAAGVPID